MKRLLIVDDDPHICELVRLYFEKEGFEVLEAGDGLSGLKCFQEKGADVILLDLMLPERNGYDVLRELRRTDAVPVLILTARGDTLDKVVGLELGADDYVAKPFEPKELIARVKAVLRRVDGELLSGSEANREQDLNSSAIARHGSLTVDKNRYNVTVGKTELDMPPKELELLFFLLSNPNRVFTREQLLENIWGFDYFGESRTVDVHIKRIREKLDLYEHNDWQIKTVWGVGYKLETKG